MIFAPSPPAFWDDAVEHRRQISDYLVSIGGFVEDVETDARLTYSGLVTATGGVAQVGTGASNWIHATLLHTVIEDNLGFYDLVADELDFSTLSAPPSGLHWAARVLAQFRFSNSTATSKFFAGGVGTSVLDPPATVVPSYGTGFVISFAAHGTASPLFKIDPAGSTGPSAVRLYYIGEDADVTLEANASTWLSWDIYLIADTQEAP